MARSRRLTELAELTLGAAAAVVDEGPVIVATSGGADSAAALWAYAQIGDVQALHVDHGWPYSRVLRAAALEVAGRVGVRLIVEDIEVTRSEGAARAARYDAFARRGGDSTIVTGHTADDLAETVVANLARGAGLDGRRGIPEARPGYLRPFLNVRRDELRELVDLLGLPALDDPSNADPSYSRVRLRRMVREWERAMGRPIVPAIARNARLAGEDATLIERWSAAIKVCTDGRAVAIELAPLRAAERPLARRAIRRALRAVDGTYAGTSADVDAAMRVVGGGPAVSVGGDVRIRRSEVRLEFLASGWDPSPLSPPVEVIGGGEYQFGRWTFTVAVTDSPPVTLAASRRHEVFDAGAVGGELTIRPLLASDRLALGGGGSKAALDAVSEQRIDVSQRAGWPILTSATAGPLWVPDVRRAAVGWVTEATRRYLVVVASQEEQWTPVEC